MRVVAVRRTPGADDFVDDMLPPDRLDELLRTSDVVLVAVPLTPDTKGMLGAEKLAHMRPDSVLVNVARGAVIDEAALIDALERQRPRWAILDVQEQEPLPPASPLWRLERCIVTPHDAARSPRSDAMRTGELGPVRGKYHC
jgi:phosphoglycerate dehydrogenase-like enzyme